MTMHAQTTLPEGGKARRVYLLLRDEITNGALPEGRLLPGEHRLADRFKVSRITVRRSLEALAADGLIEKRAGAGSIVLSRSQPNPALAADFAGLIPQLADMSRSTTARLLAVSYGPAPAPVVTALGLAAGERVQTAVRVRLYQGAPFSHLTTYVPADIAQRFDEAELATEPLFKLLERSGVRVDSATQTVSATMAAPDVADALETTVGAPLLSLHRTVREVAGRGVEYLSALYRPDHFRLEMTLTRAGAGDNRYWEPVLGGGA